MPTQGLSMSVFRNTVAYRLSVFVAFPPGRTRSTGVRSIRSGGRSSSASTTTSNNNSLSHHPTVTPRNSNSSSSSWQNPTTSPGSGTNFTAMSKKRKIVYGWFNFIFLCWIMFAEQFVSGKCRTRANFPQVLVVDHYENERGGNAFLLSFCSYELYDVMGYGRVTMFYRSTG